MLMKDSVNCSWLIKKTNHILSIKQNFNKQNSFLPSVSKSLVRSSSFSVQCFPQVYSWSPHRKFSLCSADHLYSGADDGLFKSSSQEFSCSPLLWFYSSSFTRSFWTPHPSIPPSTPRSEPSAQNVGNPTLLSSSIGHWCILGPWCDMPSPRFKWCGLWCVCGCPWPWFWLLELLLVCACCRWEFFLFFIRRFWNQILTCSRNGWVQKKRTTQAVVKERL